MAITTSGFQVSALPRFTPVDPRLATRDPNAFLRGLTTTTTALDQLGDLPRQRKLRDLELLQEEAKLADIPSRRRLQDLQLQELERRARIADLAPTEPAYKAISPLGDLVEYQERGNVDPATGVPYGIAEKPTMYESLIKTKEQLDQEARAAEALAQQRAATADSAVKRADAAMINATKPDREGVNAPRAGQTVNYPPLGREVIWSNTPENIIDAETGLPVFTSKENYATGTKELVKNPAVWNKTLGAGGTADPNAASVFGKTTSTTVPPPVAAPVGTTVPGAATAPVAGIDKPFDIAIPRGSFSNENEANAAAAAVAGTPQAFKPGDVVIINGVRHIWRED